MSTRDVPIALSNWFAVHFAADVAVAVPLFLAPTWFLSLLGWDTVDPVASRLVAAALFGIGIESLLGRKSTREALRGMLNLKIIWSVAAIIGFVVALVQGIRPWGIYPLLVIFAAFNLLWISWRRRLAG